MRYAIKCPKCSAKAVAEMQPAGIKGTYREPTVKLGVRRLVCESCGLSKDVSARDSERFELWYATQFRGHRLWAVNHEQLSFLIGWLSGIGRKADLKLGERALVEALPKWMLLAKNRPGVLQRLQRMYDA
jgi:hypothetical protein